MTAVIAAAVATSATAALAPGQQLVNYLASHSTSGDRTKITGLTLQGGRTEVVDGQPAARGVTAVVRTSLPDTAAGSFAAQRICVTTIIGRNRLGLQQVGQVAVRLRNGHDAALSVLLRYPTCHRIP